METGAEVGGMQLQAKDTKDLSNCQNWKTQEEFLPRSFRGNVALTTPWFQAFILQKGERICFYGFSHLVCGTLSWQPQESHPT